MRFIFGIACLLTLCGCCTPCCCGNCRTNATDQSPDYAYRLPTLPLQLQPCCFNRLWQGFTACPPTGQPPDQLGY